MATAAPDNGKGVAVKDTTDTKRDAKILTLKMALAAGKAPFRARFVRAISQVNERTLTEELGSIGSPTESDEEFDLQYGPFTAYTRLTAPNQLSVGSSSSAPYLSYYDILLTNEDVKSLKSDWLTDNNIAFWEEWLEREILPQYPQARICLLRPTMTFMMMRAVDLAAIVDALPNFRNVTHIFLPINDNHDTTQGEGGTHWSLLLVSVIDGIAFHYDSLHGSNWSEAQSCTRKLQQILAHQLKMSVNIRLLQLNDCPQQENMNDCGVFVCIIMRHLLIKRLLNANANEKVSMSMKDKRIDSYGGRKEMLRIIESLRKEGERRRSASPYATSRTPPRIE
ncbi:cysteine proteinase [Thozetella sp. PMI_491]|nr:cysteine proteinase [Thozetella sp. PMI_491]